MRLRKGARTFWAAILLVLVSTSSSRAQSHLVRLGDTEAGSVSRVETAGLGDERLVTAVRDQAGLLKLIVWDVLADGKFVRRGDIEAGPTSEFAIVGLATGSVVTAVQQEDGSLKLTAWSVSPSGAITRQGSTQAGQISRVAITAAGPARVVTASQYGAGATKLIAWDLDQSGQFTRRGDQTGTAGSRVAIAALSASRLACAVRNAAGKLEVSAWSLTASGNINLLGTAQGAAVTEVALTNTALDRAVTAARLSNGNLEVDAWDVGNYGTVTAASSAQAGTANNITLVALGSAKVVTALRQSDQTLKLISWQVVDKVRRLDDISAGPVGDVSAVSLGWDRVVSAVQVGGNALKLIDWGDFSVGLLHSEWGPSASASVAEATVSEHSEEAAYPDDNEELADSASAGLQPPLHKPETEFPEGVSESRGNSPQSEPSPAGQSPKASFVFEPNIEISNDGVDPMIAVGRDYAIVSQQGWIKFIYKSGRSRGNQLPSKGGELTSLSANNFFGGFLATQNTDGSVNRNNINLHLRFPPNFASTLRCEPTVSTGTPCQTSFYDTRVAHDPFRNRFVILSALRGASLGSTPSGADAVARRYFALAVSKTEDPRDGFYQYITTESNYSDWPRMAINDGVIVAAHQACKDTDANTPCGGANTTVPNNTAALRPMAYVFRTDDLLSNNTTPPNWKIYPYQTEGGTLIPVVHHGSAAGWTYLVKPIETGLDIFGFKQPLNNWIDIPPLKKSSVGVDGGISGFREGVHFRADNLYLACGKKVAERVPNQTPERWHVRGLRIPLAPTSSGGIKAGPCPGSGCLDFSFGLHALEDAPNDVLSYEMPSMAVNKDGDMIMVYGRVPVQMANPTGQEVRFSIYYHDSRGLQRSRLLRIGETVLKDTLCIDGQSESQPVTENYWHIWYQTKDSNGNVICPTQHDFDDYSTAVVDPSDDTTFWIVHEYADAETKSLKMVAGKVVP